MGFRFRARPALGPLRFNITERGLRSVSVKLGPFTWNPTRDRLTTDLPGGLYHTADLRPTACATWVGWRKRCGHTASEHVMHSSRGSGGCGATHPTRPGLCPCTHYRRTK